MLKKLKILFFHQGFSGTGRFFLQILQNSLGTPIKYLRVPLTLDYFHSVNCSPLFFTCVYCTFLWKAMMDKLELPMEMNNPLQQRITLLVNQCVRTSMLHDLTFTTATVIHYLWLERNHCRFEKKVCSMALRIKLAEVDIRLQLSRHHKRAAMEERDLIS